MTPPRVVSFDFKQQVQRQVAVEQLTMAQREFCLHYLANGYKAGPAYRASHPTCKSANAVWVNGHRMLRNAKVVAFISITLVAGWKRLQMDADEALARLSMDARADIRLLFGRDGKLLPPHTWPDSIAGSVKSFQIRKNGYGSVVLHDKLAALRLILQLHGRLNHTRRQSALALL